VRRRRHGRAGRLPAFNVTVLLDDGTKIVTTAYLRSITHDGTALYEAQLHDVDRDHVQALASRTHPPEHSLLHLRFVRGLR